MGRERKELGALGESLAADFLMTKGLRLLDRNLKMRLGEIDLLMQEEEVIVLVEVKTQSRGELIDPIYKINLAKQRKLRQLAAYLSTRYPGRNIRIDAVTLYWRPGEAAPHLTHYPNIL